MQKLEERNLRYLRANQRLLEQNKQIRQQGQQFQQQSLQLHSLLAEIQHQAAELDTQAKALRFGERALRQEKDWLSALIYSMSDEVWFANTEQKITLLNPAAKREFEISAAGEIDVEQLATSLEIYHPDGTPRPADEAPLLRALYGEILTRQEEMIRTPVTGELRWREVNATPVKDAEGAIIGSVAVVRDITERKRAEEERERLLQQQEQLLAQVRQDAETRATLLREVNHRVKNNLSAIIGLLYAQLENPALANHPEYEAVIREVVGRIEGLSIVHGMLSAAQWAPLRLDELAEHIVGTTLQAAPAGQVSIEVQPSGVRVSPNQAQSLALILSELALNESKHVLQNGASIRMVVSVTQEDGDAVLVFRDNGPGYPAEILARQSMGVGLGLVRNLVLQNLRGQLVLRNEAGAVTEIRFPLAEAENEGKEAI